MNRLRMLIKNCFFFFTRLIFLCRFFSKPNISCKSKLKYYKARINLHTNATLSIGSEVTMINSSIKIQDGGVVTIKDSCVLKNVHISVGQNATIILEEGVIFSTPSNKNSITIDSGHLHIDSFANIACDISMRFNAKLKIGKFTGIGFDSEIVCDQSVEIGKYCLISNNVDIYDTNSHSLEFEKRRERIELGYPAGCSEVKRPVTSPIIIGDDVWVGRKSIILKGAIIRNRCIVGMGSKVTSGTYTEDSVIISERSRVLTTRL